MADKIFPKGWKPIGIIGDVNPIEHWGGIVYETSYGPQLLYFQESEDTVYVHNVTIEDDVWADVNWADINEIAQYTGVSTEELREAGSSSNPLARAQVYEAIASYNGWSNFDDQPETMTVKQAERKYGSAVDAAHEHENQSRRKKVGKSENSQLKSKLLR